ncbi:DUF4760 domain-containing protein [Flavobacteriaceae bacterium 3-367]
MKHSFEKKISIKYVYLGIVFTLISAVALFVFLAYLEIEYGVLEVIAYITGMTATLTLVYHSLSLEQRIEEQKYNNFLYRSKYTYDLISEWHSPRMMDSISCARKLIRDKKRNVELKDKTKVSDFADYLEKNLNERKHLILILNYFENISTMIDSGHVDVEIVKNAFKSMFISYYEYLENYIDFRQKEYPASWAYFELVAKKWRLENKTA